MVYDKIDDAVDEILHRISSNKALLGHPVLVTERIEPPQDIELPAIFIVPVGESGDSVDFHLTSADTEHSFQIVIIGYYTFRDTTHYRTLRKYGYECLRLVKGMGQKIRSLNIRGHARIQFGYYTMSDTLIYSFSITLDVKTMGV